MNRQLIPLPKPPEASAGSRGGFTLIELLVVLFVCGLLVLILLPAIGPSPRVNSRQLKDSTQVRGILQGMVIWAQNNQDDYPLPSAVDVEDMTVATTGVAKDTTSNIFSLLIYNGFVPTEMFTSPAEANGAIEEHREYEYDVPSAAISPQAALWDPSFHGSPMSEHNLRTKLNPADIGNNSYAHAFPGGVRRPLWGSTFVATEAAIGNRGPAINGVTKKSAPDVSVDFDKQSNTLLIHGSRVKWEGNIGYSDNHVTFETDLAPQGLTYTDSAGVSWRDVLFFDEPDDANQTNADLGVWTVVGETKKGSFRWTD